MKHYASQIEFEWLEIVEAANPEDPTRIAVSEEKASELSAIYQSNKPLLQDGDSYQFIGANVSQDSEQSWGILNCRVNDEHIQVRF